MKNNRFKTIFNKRMAYTFILICVCGTSCNDMLELNPVDFYSDDTFWQKPSQAIEAINACYRTLNHNDLHGSDMCPMFNYENLTPNSYHKDNSYNTRDFARGVHTSTTQGMNLVIWRGCYRGIGRCNSVIDKVPDIEMDETLKRRIIGEAKFLRAYFYWTLNVVFNGVPLVLTFPNTSEKVTEMGSLPRSSYEQVKAQIIKDLDEAAPVLETQYTRAEDGRATKGAALALKARVLLQDLDYQGTVGACEALFALNRYSLYPNYNGIFRQANAGNSEVIFDVRWVYPTFIPQFDIIHAQYATVAPVQGLIDAYQMTDGKSYTESPLFDAANPFANRDPRLTQTIAWIGKPWRNRANGATFADFHQTGYAFIKYTEYNATTSGTLSNSTTPFVILRYADVLLMYAEALNELQGATAAVYQAVNDVRGRESVNMPPLPAGLSKEAMREAIRLERRIELAGECDYFYAIRRWKTIETVMNESVHASPYFPPDCNGQVMETRSFNPQRDYFWPIPYTQIDLNPALVQNPNY